MLGFIKLTEKQYSSNHDQDKRVMYIKVLEIQAVIEEKNGTEIEIGGGSYTVYETPEEIFKLMKETQRGQSRYG